MDSINNRGRGRKRHTSHISPPSSPSHSMAQDLPELPPASDTSGALASLPPPNEAPSPSTSLSTRTRTRQVDGATSSPGHFLRKRARVDYTFEQELDAENGSKIAPSSPRTWKRRRTEIALNESALDEDSEARSEMHSKRRASEQPQSSSTRKRITVKGPAEPQSFAPGHHDDVEVQDTIEVGGHHSEESDGSLIQRTSSGSSSHDTKAAPEIASSDSTSTQPPQPQSPPTSKMSLPPQSLPQLSHRLSPGGSAPERLHEGVQANSSGEIDKDAKSNSELPLSIAHGQNSLDSFSHLTPYVKGAYVFYPEYSEDDPEPEAEPDQVEAEADPNNDADANVKLDHMATTNNLHSEDTTAEEKMNGLIEETPADTAANSPSGEAEANTAQPPEKKQHRFKQLRSASEFTDMFQDIKSLSPAELYRRLQVANEAMVAWQDEYRDLKKITDDYDNSVRYQKEEESFQRRANMMANKKTPQDLYEKDFKVKGERAQDNSDFLIKYHRQQDKVMAEAYGFEYDARPDRVGNQDPLEQRARASRQGRLRDRPKQTAKAAELEEPIIVQGKRTRKAPERFAGDEVLSRGSTPIPTQRRGRRQNLAPENGEQKPPQLQSQAQNPSLSQPQPRLQAEGLTQSSQSSQSGPQSQAPSLSFSSSHTHTEAQDSGVSVQDHLSAPEHTEKQVPKKKGKGGRPRKNPIPEPVAEVNQTPAATLEYATPYQPQPNQESVPDQSQAPPETRKSPIKHKILLLKAQRKPGTIPQHDAEPEPEPSNPPTKRERETEEIVEEQPARKQRRRNVPLPASNSASNLILAPPLAPAVPVIEEGNATNDAEPQAPTKVTRRRTTKKATIASEPSNSTINTPFTAPVEEPRPRTASSTATADTVASTSNYQLREKRQRKFINDIPDDDFIEEPKRKRVRRAPKNPPKNPQVKKEDMPAPQRSPKPKPEPEETTLPKPRTKIRLKAKPNPFPDPNPTPASSTPSLIPSTNMATTNMDGLINSGTSGNGQSPRRTIVR